MTLQEINDKLEAECSAGYTVNEIILYAHPYRRVKVKATVNKSPENTIQKLYTVLLESIEAGFNTDADLIAFLGLTKDDFLLKELYFLRKKGYTNFISNKWIVTQQGKKFIEDNSILQVLEEEDFEFLIDAVTDTVLEKNIEFRLKRNETNLKQLTPKINYPHKSPDLLNDKNIALADIYKRQSDGKSALIDYDKSNILFDSKDREFHNYYLIEYKPNKGREDESDSFIEIRDTDKNLTLQRRLTSALREEHDQLIEQLSDSERTIINKLQQEQKVETVEVLTKSVISPAKTNKKTQHLSIWKTQAKFREAIKTAKNKLLIESPWIKRATLNYADDIEKALKRGVEIIILYGIEFNDEHYKRAERKMEEFNNKYKNFHLIHLPTHFEDIGNNQKTGTHRKLVIKDDEYYISGSFNFLSFNKKEGQKVANEESHVFYDNVKQKWQEVINEYSLNIKIK